MRKLILTLVSSCFFTIVINATSIKMFDGYYDYAVIINGGGDMYSNYERYWNDCSAIYKLLVNDYGYPKDHIYVIMSDGTDSSYDRALINGGYGSSPLDLDGDGINDIQYSATKTNISSVFNTLSNLLSTNNKLIVYTTGPGKRINGTSYITLWNNVDMSPSELNTEINKISAKAINILMQQDYCGGFSNTLLSSNRSVSTACSSTTQANILSGYAYNTFTYFFHKAASFGEENSNDNEEFDFKEIVEIVDEVATSDSGAGYLEGSSPNLRDNYIAQIFIDGPNNICNNAIYTSRDPVALETIQWSTQNNCLSITSGQGSNSVTISKNANGLCEIYVTYSISNTTRTVKKSVSVGSPPEDIGTGLSIISPSGNYGYWSSSENGNKFSITGNINGTYNHYLIDFFIYRLNNNFYPSEMVYHGSSYNKTNINVPSYSAGWYLLKARGYNDCGYSEWLEQEVEMVDNSWLNLLLDYDSATETITLTLNEPTSESYRSEGENPSKTARTYEIEIWNNTSMVRYYKTNLTTFQISLSGLPDGIYIIKVIKNGQTFSRKFVKNSNH